MLFLLGSAIVAGKKRKRLVTAALLACLFVQGLIFGLLWLKMFVEPATTIQIDSAETPQAILSVPNVESTLAIYAPQQHRQMAEKLILGDNPAQAIPHLLNAAPNRIEQADDDLLFRIALCFEASRDFPRAAGYYAQLADQANNEYLTDASRNGLARCRMQLNDAIGSRQLLWKQYLLSGSNQLSSELNEEALFLLALSFSGTVREHGQQLLQSGRLIQNLHPPLNVARQLGMVNNAQTGGISLSGDAAKSTRPGQGADNPEIPDKAIHSRTVKNEDQPVRIGDVMQVGEGIENLFASFYAEQANLVSFMQWTTTKLELPMEITDKGKELADQQLISLSMDHISLATALDIQTLPFGLGWQINNNSVTIFALDEAPEELLRQIHRNAAIRILERVLIIASDHQHSDYLRFQLSGLQNQLGNSAQTIAINLDLLTNRIDPRLRLAINFNLGQLQTIYDDGPTAIESFGRVVDSNEGGSIKTVAFIRVAQIHLQLGQHDQAVAAFSRAFRSSEQPWFRQIAKIGVASTYLLNDQPRLASKVIQDGRRVFADSDMRSVADFLLAYSVIADSPGQSSYEARGELLSSLARIKWAPELGAHGELLAARAYQELGFSDEAIGILQASLQRADSSWLREQAVEQLTSILMLEGRNDEARNALLNAIKHPEFSDNGLLLSRLATIEYQSGHREDCLRLCNRILAIDQSSQYHAEALKLMGSIFQERGEHYHAALCFSGLLPDQGQKNEPGE